MFDVYYISYSLSENHLQFPLDPLSRVLLEFRIPVLDIMCTPA